MNVYQKLNEAREAFHSAPLKKSGLNKFAGYKYFELGDFIIPALRIFKDIGLTSVIRFGIDQAVMEIVNTDKPEEKILITSPMSTAALKGCHEVQNLGAVQTYLRRYLWVAALEIIEHDAIDSSAGKKTPAPVITPKGDIGNDIPADEKEFLSEMAASCEELVLQNKTESAAKMLDEASLESDQKVWLWSLLSSSTRSAIKKSKS